MPQVDIREKVPAVRSKIGLAGPDFQATWRAVNEKAQDISYKENGNKPLGKASTLSSIKKLKEYYAEPREGEDEEARLKLVNALEVKGAAAWIVNTAIKANYDRSVRDEKRQGVPGQSSAGAGPANDAGPLEAPSITRTTMFDPIRDA